MVSTQRKTVAMRQARWIVSRMEHLRQRTIASYHLQPLSFDETKRYIGYRLVAVGWDGDPFFDQSFYEAVFERSGGIPRKINILMERLLVYGYLEELREFTGEHVERVVDEMSEEIAGDMVKPVEDTVAEADDARAEDGAPGDENSVTREEIESRLASLEKKLQQLAGGAE